MRIDEEEVPVFKPARCQPTLHERWSIDRLISKWQEYLVPAFSSTFYGQMTCDVQGFNISLTDKCGIVQRECMVKRTDTKKAGFPYWTNSSLEKVYDCSRATQRWFSSNCWVLEIFYFIYLTTLEMSEWLFISWVFFHIWLSRDSTRKWRDKLNWESGNSTGLIYET